MSCWDLPHSLLESNDMQPLFAGLLNIDSGTYVFK